VVRVRLLAENLEDLQVISALVQDAIVRVGDIRHHGKDRATLITMNRFCWEKGRLSPPARMRSALQVNGVMGVKSKGIARGKQNGMLELLAIEFEPDESQAPGGTLQLDFSDGGVLVLEVEMLDVVLLDTAGPWGAKSRPRHGR
jgi:hypothetical protein